MSPPGIAVTRRPDSAKAHLSHSPARGAPPAEERRSSFQVSGDCSFLGNPAKNEASGHCVIQIPRDGDSVVVGEPSYSSGSTLHEQEVSQGPTIPAQVLGHSGKPASSDGSELASFLAVPALQSPEPVEQASAASPSGGRSQGDLRAGDWVVLLRTRTDPLQKRYPHVGGGSPLFGQADQRP